MCSTATMADAKSSSIPPYCSGIVMPVRPSSAALRRHCYGHAGFVVLDGFHVGADFLGPELIHRAGDGQVFGSQIFRGKDLVRLALFDQESAAFGFR